MRRLLGKPEWLSFMVIGIASGLSLASMNYLFPYLSELGASESLMGVTLTVGTVVELPLMLFADRILRRFSAFRLLIFSMLMMGLRLLLMAAATGPAWILATQTLNIASFPLMWVAGVSYANALAPDGMKATGQGLLASSVNGIGMAIGGFIGGPLLVSLGGRGLYFVFGGIVIVLISSVVLMNRHGFGDTQRNSATQMSSML